VRSLRDALTLLVLLLLVLSVRVAPLGEAMDSLIPAANASDTTSAPVPAPDAEPSAILPASLDSPLVIHRQEIQRSGEHSCRVFEASVSTGENGEGRVIFVLEVDEEATAEIEAESVETEELVWSAGKSC